MTKKSKGRSTPGPWGVEWTEQRAWIGPMRKNDGKVYRIVCSTEREGLIPESLAEKDANARLIAAAPELLEALAFYVTICGNTAAQVSRETAQEMYEQAGRALKKATSVPVGGNR